MIFSIEDGRENFYQWDSNRRLIIHDENITEVHFCNKTDDCSLVTEVYSQNGTRYANVPNVLLTMDWSIKVYAFDKYYTKHCETYKVIPRTKPADYAYEETEVMNWHTLEDKVDKLIFDVGQAEVTRITNEEYRELGEFERREAENFRQNNETAREEAEAERQEVFDNLTADVVYLNNQATNVLDSANEALANSEAAISNATEAATLATNKANEADTAAKSANNAALEANAASTKATTATGKANEATTKAETATVNAETATTNANNAATGANNAATGANEAANRANEAANGINNKFANALKGEVSGAIVSMDDVSPVEHEIGVKVKSNNLIPYPWSLTHISPAEMFSFNGDGTLTINGTHNKYPQAKLCSFTLPVGKYFVSSGVDNNSLNLSVRIRYKNTATDIGHSIAIPFFELSEPTEVDCTVIGNIGVSYENVVVKPMLKEGTTATAYTPYVPDITQAKLLKQGGNLLDISRFYKGAGTLNSDGSLTISLSYVYQIMAEYTGMLPSGTYTITNFSTKTLYVQHKSTDYSVRCSPNGGTLNFTYDGVSYLRFISAQQEANESVTYKYMLNLGKTALPHELYTAPTEYPINEDGTVEGVNSLYPTTTLLSDTTGVRIEAEYNKDLNKAFAELQNAIISLGANI